MSPYDFMAKKLRSDALLNRSLLLDAAANVFLEHGITAPLDIVIDKASLGRATFYRNFPDRAALIVALLDAAHTRLETTAARIRADEHKVFKIFVHIGKSLMVNPILVDAWRVLGSDTPEIQAFVHRARRTFEEPVSIAVAEGTLRADFSVDDVTIITGMMSAVVRQRQSEARVELVTRVLTIIIAGLAGPKLTAHARGEILQFADNEAAEDFTENVAYLFLPVARDGLPFHPGLAVGGRFKVGDKGVELQLEDFSEALEVLQAMEIPSWHRPDADGHVTLVRGVGWRRFRADALALLSYKDAEKVQDLEVAG